MIWQYIIIGLLSCVILYIILRFYSRFMRRRCRATPKKHEIGDYDVQSIDIHSDISTIETSRLDSERQALEQERLRFDEEHKLLEEQLKMVQDDSRRLEEERMRYREESRHLERQMEELRNRIIESEAEYQRIKMESLKAQESIDLALRKREEADANYDSRDGNYLVPLPSNATAVDKQTVYSALYAPVAVEVSRWFKVQVHLYTKEDAGRAARKSLELDKFAEKKEYNPLTMKLKEGMGVQVDLSVFEEGVHVQKSVRYLVWNGELTSAFFMVKVEDPSLKEIAGEVTLSVEGAPVGVLSFIVAVSTEPVTAEKFNLGRAKPFRKAFISYSHLDVEKAATMAALLRAQEIPYFWDVQSLGPGAVFNDDIKESIDNCDLFLLLWSKNAADSEFVEKEYLYAMQYAAPQRDLEEATLAFRAFFVQPEADPPTKLKDIYSFYRIRTVY